MTALIGMVNHRAGTTPVQGHVEGIQHQPTTQVGSYGPAHYSAAPSIHLHAQIQKTRSRGKVGVGSDRSALFASRRVGFCGPPSEPDMRLSPYPALPVFGPMSGGSCATAHGCGFVSSLVLYPGLRLFEIGPQCADIHQRPSRNESLLRKRWGPSHVTGFPGLGLLRLLHPLPSVSAGDEPSRRSDRSGLRRGR